jgi:hypothetical protein
MFILNIKQVKQLSQLTHPRHLATPMRVVNYVTAVHALVATVYGRRRLRKSEEQFWYVVNLCNICQSKE